jgi:alkylhydroperoxidase/carboxymuconolactone decarboxylase family protein YurZ
MSETPVLDTLAAMTAEALARSDLDDNTLLTARLAALAAVDAPPASYLMHLGPALDAGVTIDQVQGILVAIAPIIGAPRTIIAARNITTALGIAITAVAAEAEADAAASA